MAVHMTFFPLGNADSTLIRLADDDLILFDYADMRCADDPTDKRIDLPKELRAQLADAERASFRVVAFTHLDDDHICGASDFFWFQYSSALQGDKRVRIDEMWVPAAAITETNLTGDAYRIRQEARHRLKKGEGIKVFSRPENLSSYLKECGLSISERENCIVDAGKYVPGFSKNDSGQVEFFVHSPFAWRTDEGLEDRNENSIIVQMTVSIGTEDSYALLGADINYDSLSEIVQTSRKHGNEDRLKWDVLKLFHHCSYKSLSDEKGDDKTAPVADVDWLFRELARQNEIIVSPSKPIPTKGSADDEDPQPPHRQAANYYKEIVADSDGKFLVTMETPSRDKPKPIRLKFSAAGVTHLTIAAPTVASAAASNVTRAG